MDDVGLDIRDGPHLLCLLFYQDGLIHAQRVLKNPELLLTSVPGGRGFTVKIAQSSHQAKLHEMATLGMAGLVYFLL